MIPARREVVETDASLLGLIAVWQHRTINDRWSTQHRWEQIHVPELRAIFLALQHFLPVLKGWHVLVPTDSTSAVYHINHQGGTRSKLGLQVSEQLLTWAFPHFLSLRAIHLPGVQNSVADVLFRQGLPQGDWRLLPKVMEMIWSRYGIAEVDVSASDVSASETSTHCLLWYSLMEGTSPLRRDALAHARPARLLYAFPPNSAQKSAGKSAMEQPQTVTGGPQLARAAMVSGAAETTPEGATAPPKETGPSLSAGGMHMASESELPSALDLAIWSQEPPLASCEQSVIDTVLSSRAPSTRSLYANRWKLFSEWCQTQGELPGNCSVAIILCFLQSLLDACRCASTLKLYAVAISAGHVRVNNQTRGSHYLVSQFLKGAQRRRPSRVTVVLSWDLTLVLRSVCQRPFELIGEAEFRWLSAKTAYLLAITLAKRVGELHTQTVSQMCMRWYTDGSLVTLLPNPSFLPKRGAFLTCKPDN